MSTKIYNGYEFVGGDLTDFLKMCENTRKRYIEEIADKLIKHISIGWLIKKDESLKKKLCATKDIDNVNYFSDLNSFDLNTLLITIIDDKLNNHKISEWMYNYISAEIKVFNYYDEKLEKERLIVYHYMHDSLFREIFNQDYFEDFHYQNQSDKPKDISKKEWNRRRVIWDDILEDNFTLANKGFLFRFHNHETLYKIADLITKTIKEENNKPRKYCSKCKGRVKYKMKRKTKNFKFDDYQGKINQKIIVCKECGKELEKENLEKQNNKKLKRLYSNYQGLNFEEIKKQKRYNNGANLIKGEDIFESHR